MKLKSAFFLIIFFFTLFLFPQDVNFILLNENVNDISFLSALEKEIAAELNLARTNPKQYSKKLVETKKYYDGNNFKEPEQITLITDKGIDAVNEAIKFLEENI